MVEGPWIVNNNGWYYLFYSGHSYCDATYSVGVARSRNPLGPYEKKGDPILKTENDGWVGPGHCSVLKQVSTGRWVIIYHAWKNGAVCGGNARYMMAQYIAFDNNEWPYIVGEQSPALSDAFLQY